MRYPPRLRVLALTAAVLAMALAPLDVYPLGMFSNYAFVDTSQAVYVPGERWCPQLDPDDFTHCAVDLVEGAKPLRPDWDQAMRRCRAAGFTQDECKEAVEEDGEF